MPFAMRGTTARFVELVLLAVASAVIYVEWRTFLTDRVVKMLLV